MAFRRRGFRRGWGGPFWGPAPLLYTGAAVGAGYAIGRRGGDYYGEDPYPQPGIAPQQRPSQLIVRVHAGSGLRDRCWTTRQDVVAEVYLYIDGSLFSRARVPEVARGGGGDPVWRGGRNAVALPLPPRLDLARASLSVQLLCANVLMQDQLIGTTGRLRGRGRRPAARHRGRPAGPAHVDRGVPAGPGPGCRRAARRARAAPAAARRLRGRPDGDGQTGRPTRRRRPTSSRRRRPRTSSRRPPTSSRRHRPRTKSRCPTTRSCPNPSPPFPTCA